MSEHDQQLAEWLKKQGVQDADPSNEAEIRMAAEELASTESCWCMGCDEELPVKEMQLITMRIDPYLQLFDGEGDYIPPQDRVRMCKTCFQEEYGV